MKPIVTGLLSFAIGAASSVAVMAATDQPIGGNKEAIEKIVHDYIMANPEVIIESVQKGQERAQLKQVESAKDAIKASAKELFEDDRNGSVGPKDASITIVEFFDYNCPACHMMFKSIDELVKKDKDVRIIFKELPIFGPQSDENSKVAMAVVALAPEKYFPFHEKMMSGVGGRISSDKAIAYAVELGLDETALKAEMKKDYIAEKIASNHAIAEKLGVRGTPALIVGDEMIPSALDYASLAKLIAEKRKAK